MDGEVKIQVKLLKEQLQKDIGEAKRLLGSLGDTKVDGSKFDFRQYLKGSTEAARDLAQQLDIAATRLGAAGQMNDFSKQALTAFAALDSAKAKLSTISPESDKLTASLAQLSKELGYQASTTELVNSAYNTVSAGFKDAASATEVLKAATVGSVGGFSDVDTVTKALTSTLNVYNLKATDSAAVVDKFAAVQQSGVITIAEYAAQISKIGPIASAAGVSLDELNGFIATATAKGVPAEQTFAGLRQAIAATLKPSGEAAELANQLGIRFDAQALKTKGLSGIMGELNARGLDTAQNLSILFGSVEALTAIAPTAGEGFKLLKENIVASANSAGLAQANFEKVAKSFNGKVKAAFNEANNALVSLGSGAAKAIKPLISALTFLVKNFNALPEPVKQAVGVVIGLTGGALTLAGALAGLAAIVPAIVAGFSAASAAAAAFGIALAAAIPLIGAITAAVALITFVKFTADLKASNEAIDEFSVRADAASSMAISAAERTKSAITRLNQIRESGRALTAAEINDANNLVKANVQRLASIKEELEAAKNLVVTDEAQKNAKANLIAQLTVSAGALEGQNKKLNETIVASKGAGAANQELGKSLQQLEAEYQKAGKALDASTQKQIAAAKLAQAEGTATATQTQATLATIEQEGIAKRIAINEASLAGLRAVASTSDKTRQAEAKEAQTKIAEIETQTYQLQADLAGKQIAEEQRVSAERVAILERSAAAAKAVTETAELERVNATLQIQRDGYASEATLREQQLTDERTTLKERLQAQADYVAQLEQLPKPTAGSDEALALEQKIQAAKLETGRLHLLFTSSLKDIPEGSFRKRVQKVVK